MDGLWSQDFVSVYISKCWLGSWRLARRHGQKVSIGLQPYKFGANTSADFNVPKPTLIDPLHWCCPIGAWNVPHSPHRRTDSIVGFTWRKLLASIGQRFYWGTFSISGFSDGNLPSIMSLHWWICLSVGVSFLLPTNMFPSVFFRPWSL